MAREYRNFTREEKIKAVKMVLVDKKSQMEVERNILGKKKCTGTINRWIREYIQEGEEYRVSASVKKMEEVYLEVLSKPNNLNLIAKDAFQVADKDSNGYIDLEEFELCMKNVSESFGLKQPKKEKVEYEFERLDVDKNGTIDFDEFKNYVKEIIDLMVYA